MSRENYRLLDAKVTGIVNKIRTFFDRFGSTSHAAYNWSHDVIHQLVAVERN